jgi:hypothetical protein
MSNMDVPITLQAARNYLLKGFSVIPILPRGKKPAIPWKEYQQRPPTEEELVQWFGNGAKNNIGIVTGSVSGLAVVDLDSDQAFAFAKAKNLPPGPTVKTGRGFHLYCKAKDGVRNFQQRDDLPDIDLRADGGYVVAPPSVHESGTVYGWVKGRGLGEVEMAELPSWVLAEKPEEKKAVGELYHGVEKGGRNKALARLVGSFVNDGGSLQDIQEQALLWNSAIAEPLPVEEVERTVKSIYERHHGWPDPEPIDMDLLTVQPLPFEVLPEPFRSWIEDVSHRMQCPPDFVAVAALTLTGSLIGTRCGIRPKQKDDWLVIPNLWGGAVGQPSTLKTPSLNEAMKPLMRLEAEAKKKFDAESEQHEVELMEVQARKEALKTEMKNSAANKKNSKPMDTIKKDMLELEEPEKPIMTRYKTNDSTIEKLSEILNDNPSGILNFRDELIGLLATWEKPGRESDRAFFLEAWDGGGSHTTDRIGRGTIFTENLCISIFGGIQPSKLTSYLIQSMSGLENDGMFQRLQMLVYPDEVKKKDWKFVDQSPDRGARERAYKIIECLAHMDFTKCGATKDEFERFPYLQFSEDTQHLFNEWLTELEMEKIRGSDHPMILEHFGKYRSLMPSLALIFHLIDVADGSPSGPVSLQAAEKAAAFCEYLESHARRVYGLVANIDQQAAAILAEKIQAKKLNDGFTVRDVYRKNWHLLNDRELAQPACDELAELGWLKVERREKEGTGRSALPIYHINPKVKIVGGCVENNTD